MAEALGSPRLLRNNICKGSGLSTLNVLDLPLIGLRIGETTPGEEAVSEKSATFLTKGLQGGDRGGEMSLWMAVEPEIADIWKGWSSPNLRQTVFFDPSGGV